MSKVPAGRVMAHCPGKGANGKAQYISMGLAFKDTDTGYLSLKIDALPIASAGWSGWVNIFADDRKPVDAKPQQARSQFHDFDDDIPF